MNYIIIELGQFILLKKFFTWNSWQWKCTINIGVDVHLMMSQMRQNTIVVLPQLQAKADNIAEFKNIL